VVLDAAAHTRPGVRAVKDATTRVSALVQGAAGGGLAALGPTAVFSVHLDATHGPAPPQAVKRPELSAHNRPGRLST
jgi:hypothetical protein